MCDIAAAAPCLCRFGPIDGLQLGDLLGRGGKVELLRPATQQAAYCTHDCGSYCPPLAALHYEARSSDTPDACAQRPAHHHGSWTWCSCLTSMSWSGAGYGKVYRGRWRGAIVAVKVVDSRVQVRVGMPWLSASRVVRQPCTSSCCPAGCRRAPQLRRHWPASHGR